MSTSATSAAPVRRRLSVFRIWGIFAVAAGVHEYSTAIAVAKPEHVTRQNYVPYDPAVLVLNSMCWPLQVHAYLSNYLLRRVLGYPATLMGNYRQSIRAHHYFASSDESRAVAMILRDRKFGRIFEIEDTLGNE